MDQKPTTFWPLNSPWVAIASDASWVQAIFPREMVLCRYLSPELSTPQIQVVITYILVLPCFFFVNLQPLFVTNTKEK